MIRLNDIEKRYARNYVLKKVSFEIEPGKITAIVGPNGSGKTTIIKSILGLVKPDSGNISIDGKPIKGEHSYRRMIGYMPQIASFPENLTVSEVIKMISDLREEEIDIQSNLIDLLNLIPELGKRISTLSGGNKQKLSAYVALIFNPKIIILDEPTAGLDPLTSTNFKQRILEERDNGKTVVLTSHIMTEIEELADNIIFLIEGKILFNGMTKTLIEQSGHKKLEKAIADLMAGNGK